MTSKGDLVEKPRLSLLEEIEANPIEARELAAANLEHEFVWAMDRALKKSGYSISQVAKILGVNEEVIAPILRWENPCSIAFVGRFLKACGFEAEIFIEGLERPDARPRRSIPYE